MAREYNPYKQVKRQLTVFFIVGGGVLVPIGEDWLADRLRTYLAAPSAGWGAEAVAIIVVATLFIALFAGAQTLLDFCFRKFPGFRRWIFGAHWIEGRWKDEVERSDIARSAEVVFSYEGNGDVSILGMVFGENRKPLYRFESIKTTMNRAELQFMYKTVGPALPHDAYGFACFNFWGEGTVPQLYTGYFVDTEGLGRVTVEGRRIDCGKASSGGA